jgi:putative sugar O-methyltransferase
VGSPRKFSIPLNYISDAGIRHSYYLAAFRRLVKPKIHSVLEIGGGFGGLCNLLMRETEIDTYYSVDLPENLLLQNYYLHENGHQVLPWSARTKRDLNAPCIFLLNGDEISDLDCQIDLLINTMSMQHMTQKNLEFYFHHINRLRIQFMYLVNRNTIRDETDVKLENYPIPETYRNVLLKSVFGKNHLEAFYVLER